MAAKKSASAATAANTSDLISQAIPALGRPFDQTTIIHVHASRRSSAGVNARPSSKLFKSRQTWRNKEPLSAAQQIQERKGQRSQGRVRDAGGFKNRVLQEMEKRRKGSTLARSALRRKVGPDAVLVRDGPWACGREEKVWKCTTFRTCGMD